jgi:hypothetical protein
MPVITETTISELDLFFEHLLRVFSIIDLVCYRVARPLYVVLNLFVRTDYFFDDVCCANPHVTTAINPQAKSLQSFFNFSKTFSSASTAPILYDAS